MRRQDALACAVLALALVASRAGEQVGRAAPACTLTAIGGSEPISFAPERGKVLWIDFWASWCATCAQSFPFLVALDRDYRARGLEIIGVNLDEEPADAQAFLARYDVGFEQAADPSGRCPQAYGVEALPSAYLVDRSGSIRHVQRGFRASESAELRARVEGLLAEGAAAPGTAR